MNLSAVIGWQYASGEPRIMKNAIATLVLGGVSVTAAVAQITVNGRVVTYTLASARAGATIDYANAKPLPAPVANIPPISQSEAIRTAPDPLMLFGSPKTFPGSVGSGKEGEIQLAPPKQFEQKDAVVPEFSTEDLPFTTSRVNAEDDYTAKYFPFHAAGKLFITTGFSSLTCSASLIDRGIVVTAAHCVVKHGTRNFASTAEYVPAWDNGTAPYGKWDAGKFLVPLHYVDDKDDCATPGTTPRGVICDDDVAILTLKAKSGGFAGDSTGWFGIGYDGYGFTASG
jgi:hypothetical protein